MYSRTIEAGKAPVWLGHGVTVISKGSPQPSSGEPDQVREAPPHLGGVYLNKVRDITATAPSLRFNSPSGHIMILHPPSHKLHFISAEKTIMEA